MRLLKVKDRQQGFILNAEFMLFVAVLVMGLLVGWVTLRDSFNAELVDTANAIEGSITFYYFNDPDRGLGPAFVPNTMQFCADGEEEGLVVTEECLDAGLVLPNSPLLPADPGNVDPVK